MRTTNVLAVQSYGYINSPEDMGSGAIGSRARILSAAMYVRAGVIPHKDLIALFPQGVSKADPTGPGRSLGNMMAEYLKTRPEMEGVEVHHKALGWGTANDILHTYDMIRDLGYSKAHISFVTDPAHLRRIKLIWHMTRPKRWTASFHPAFLHRMTFKERFIREPIAFAKDAIKLAFY